MVKLCTARNGKWLDAVIKFETRRSAVIVSDDPSVTTLYVKSRASNFLEYHFKEIRIRAIFDLGSADVAVHHSLVLSGVYHP